MIVSEEDQDGDGPRWERIKMGKDQDGEGLESLSHEALGKRSLERGRPVSWKVGRDWKNYCLLTLRHYASQEDPRSSLLYWLSPPTTTNSEGGYSPPKSPSALVTPVSTNLLLLTCFENLAFAALLHPWCKPGHQGHFDVLPMVGLNARECSELENFGLEGPCN